MIEIYLYGKLRRFARDRDPTGLSIGDLEVKNGDTIKAVLMRLGIPMKEVGSNIFLNRQYSDFARKVKDGDPLAVFPDDMQLLYRWYFNKAGPDDDVPASA
ncbi:MAG: MoaD/ThiS family protein [Deltaproteobacteria bacterium]|nr:MoaD/ThiS family protein [Deltaproteobacteria bacterium]